MEEKNYSLESTTKTLTKMFPDKTMLTVSDIVRVYGFNSSQSVYTAIKRKKGFPKPIKRCGKWYWNIFKIAEDMAS